MVSNRRLDPKPVAPQVTSLDDFKLIKGIGPKVERGLHEVGIYTYAQLLKHSAADIAALLGAKSHTSVERILKEDWIGQAQDLASSRRSQATDPAEAQTVQSRVTEASGINDAGTGTRTNLPLSVEVSSISLEAVFDQPPLMDEPPSSFRVYVEFQLLSGTLPDDSGIDQACYVVYVLAHDLDSGRAVALVNARGELQQGISVYRPALEFNVPQAGRYQIFGAVLILNHGAVGAALGPVVRVEP